MKPTILERLPDPYVRDEDTHQTLHAELALRLLKEFWKRNGLQERVEERNPTPDMPILNVILHKRRENPRKLIEQRPENPFVLFGLSVSPSYAAKFVREQTRQVVGYVRVWQAARFDRFDEEEDLHCPSSCSDDAGLRFALLHLGFRSKRCSL